MSPTAMTRSTRCAMMGEPSLGLTYDSLDGRNLSNDWARRYLEKIMTPYAITPNCISMRPIPMIQATYTLPETAMARVKKFRPALVQAELEKAALMNGIPAT